MEKEEKRFSITLNEKTGLHDKPYKVTFYVPDIIDAEIIFPMTAMEVQELVNDAQDALMRGFRKSMEYAGGVAESTLITKRV